MKIAILTSPNQWFLPYAKALQNEIFGSKLFLDYEQIWGFDVVFILSYHKIIPQKQLCQNKKNIIIHASNLPLGKGWSPLFWQVLEGKNEIVFSMFEAGKKADDGDIYMQKTLHLTGFELNQSLREKQANFCIKMCHEFLKNPNLEPKSQFGKESFYPKRSPKDSELDINKSIKEQFSLLRICDNDEFPAFFRMQDQIYILKIYNQNETEQKQGTGNREQGTGNREQGTGNREQGTGNREQGTGNREQGTGNREQAT